MPKHAWLAFIDDVLTYARQEDPHSIKVFENLKKIEAEMKGVEKRMA